MSNEISLTVIDCAAGFKIQKVDFLGEEVKTMSARRWEIHLKPDLRDLENGQQGY